MSENHNISSLFDRSGNLTPGAMESYLRHELDADSRAIVDRHLAASPFEREAVEGLKMQLSGDFRQDKEELDEKIMQAARQKKVPSKSGLVRRYYWAAAAGLVAFIGLTVVLVFMFREPEVEKQLAYAPPVPEKEKNEAIIQPAGQAAGGISAVEDKKTTFEQPDISKVIVPAESPVVAPVESPVMAPAEPETIQAAPEEPALSQATIEALPQEAEIAIVEDSQAMDEVISMESDMAMQEMVLEEIAVPEERKSGGRAKRTGAANTILAEQAMKAPADDTLKKDAAVFTVVEEMPQFPGGDNAFYRYLAENLHYPDAARINKIQGRVFVQFVVNADSTISDVKVLRGIGGGCDEEAVRVIESMPKWIPGKQRGQAIRVQYTLPVMFRLEKGQ